MEKLITYMNFPQTASYNVFCRCVSHLLHMHPEDKMKMAFDFYAHKYEDKITIHDAFTVMSHLTPFDYLLQRDLKQIFKGLIKARDEKGNSYASPKQGWKSLDRGYDELSKRSSPEKEILVVPKIVKKRRNFRSKSKRKRIKLKMAVKEAIKSPVGKDSKDTPHTHMIKIVDHFSMSSPAKSLNITFTKKSSKITSKPKSFLEYTAELYSKLQRIQKHKGIEESLHPGNPKQKTFLGHTTLNLHKNMKSEMINPPKVEECRRGLSVLNLSELGPNECFKMYIEELNLYNSREYITFDDF